MSAKNKTPMTKKIHAGVAAFAALILLAVGFFVFRGGPSGGAGGGYTDPATGDLIIPVDTLSEKAAFFPCDAQGTKMEVLALIAPDGTVRTAFNTCQVCFSSGRGYYKLDGVTLVCQNCGNRFSPDQVGRQSGGCNPIPIPEEYKSESDGSIVISRDVLTQAASVFGNWKA